MTTAQDEPKPPARLPEWTDNRLVAGVLVSMVPVIAGTFQGMLRWYIPIVVGAFITIFLAAVLYRQLVLQWISMAFKALPTILMVVAIVGIGLLFTYLAFAVTNIGLDRAWRTVTLTAFVAPVANTRQLSVTPFVYFVILWLRYAGTRYRRLTELPEKRRPPSVLAQAAQDLSVSSVVVLVVVMALLPVQEILARPTLIWLLVASLVNAFSIQFVLQRALWILDRRRMEYRRVGRVHVDTLPVLATSFPLTNALLLRIIATGAGALSMYMTTRAVATLL